MSCLSQVLSNALSSSIILVLHDKNMVSPALAHCKQYELWPQTLLATCKKLVATGPVVDIVLVALMWPGKILQFLWVDVQERCRLAIEKSRNIGKKIITVPQLIWLMSSSFCVAMQTRRMKRRDLSRKLIDLKLRILLHKDLIWC